MSIRLGDYVQIRGSVHIYVVSKIDFDNWVEIQTAFLFPVLSQTLEECNKAKPAAGLPLKVKAYDLLDVDVVQLCLFFKQFTGLIHDVVNAKAH